MSRLSLALSLAFICATLLSIGYEQGKRYVPVPADSYWLRCQPQGKEETRAKIVGGRMRCEKHEKFTG